MMELFKTNITEVKYSTQIIRKLNEKFTDYKINFDLEDCVKIIRVEGESINIKGIVDMAQRSNILLQILE